MVRTEQMFSGHTRPAWVGQGRKSGNKVDFTQTVAGWYPRTVMGIVVPVTTTERPSALTSVSGNMTDKAHRMAREPGGRTFRKISHRGPIFVGKRKGGARSQRMSASWSSHGRASTNPPQPGARTGRDDAGHPDSDQNVNISAISTQ